MISTGLPYHVGAIYWYWLSDQAPECIQHIIFQSFCLFGPNFAKIRFKRAKLLKLFPHKRMWLTLVLYGHLLGDNIVLALCMSNEQEPKTSGLSVHQEEQQQALKKAHPSNYTCTIQGDNDTQQSSASISSRVHITIVRTACMQMSENDDTHYTHTTHRKNR